jgi:hypothetical protein
MKSRGCMKTRSSEYTVDTADTVIVVAAASIVDTAAAGTAVVLWRQLEPVPPRVPG